MHEEKGSTSISTVKLQQEYVYLLRYIGYAKNEISC